MEGSRTVNDYLTAAYAEQARAEKLTEEDTRNPDRTALVWAVSSVSSALQAIAVAINNGGVADGGFVRDGSEGWSGPPILDATKAWRSFNVTLQGVEDADEICAFAVTARSSAEAGQIGVEMASRHFPKVEWEVDIIEPDPIR